MPGDNVEMTVELIVPVAIEEGLRFAIREGGRTVGAGVVSARARPRGLAVSHLTWRRLFKTGRCTNGWRR